jgi:dTDP-4-dehydrorhamnose 3,5-epimerase
MHVYSDDRGFSVMSVLDHVPGIPGQVNTSILYAGAVKAWHRHALQDDLWTVPFGNLKIGLFNTESESLAAELRLAGSVPGAHRDVPIEVPPNSGRAIFLGEHRPGVLRIPTRLWHGCCAVGGRNAVLVYYVTRRYDPAQPDEERMEWNKFPFRWEPEFH